PELSLASRPVRSVQIVTHFGGQGLVLLYQSIPALVLDPQPVNKRLKRRSTAHDPPTRVLPQASWVSRVGQNVVGRNHEVPPVDSEEHVPLIAVLRVG